MATRNAKTGLTPNELKFCFEYIKDSNGTRSYMVAFNFKKKNSAAVLAGKLLKKVNVKAEIERLMQAAAEEADVQIKDIIRAYKVIAFGDIRELYNPGNDLKDITKMSYEEAMLLTGFGKSTTMFGRSEKARHDQRMKALEKLGQYKKMWDTEPEAPTVNITIEARSNG